MDSETTGTHYLVTHVHLFFPRSSSLDDNSGEACAPSALERLHTYGARFLFSSAAVLVAGLFSEAVVSHTYTKDQHL